MRPSIELLELPLEVHPEIGGRHSSDGNERRPSDRLVFRRHGNVHERTADQPAGVARRPIVRPPSGTCQDTGTAHRCQLNGSIGIGQPGLDVGPGVGIPEPPKRPQRRGETRVVVAFAGTLEHVHQGR